ncbi:hypothetical protein GLAREA_07578 [Glarea lozoyensis ATCC 20868]|uniref:Killer toxin Kp4 domain-containing protein n=1 Tax=Glarea lozoyensis (strain ATCC 20868 / MF5171) TaxID=1116229 RepID=S3D3S5_GLAL2|nr:uncharacterized protein GLAREA_07578 [Glarea lozoyensis ATCC 20868]EPE32445.1 hypothetical protein GLAREA_07578 [Glarea lozoyensis ATCC 20868]
MLLLSFLLTLLSFLAVTIAQASADEKVALISNRVLQDLQAELTPRQKSTEEDQKATICCPVPGQPWKHSTKGKVDSTLGILFEEQSDPNTPTGTCKQLACNSASEIRVCNTGQTVFDKQQGLDKVKSSVSSIMNHCSTCCGQMFLDDVGINVIIDGNADC